MLDLNNLFDGILAKGFLRARSASFLRVVWKRSRPYRLDVLIVVAMTAILCYGASWQFNGFSTDLGRYQCYAVAFWQGEPALHSLPRRQCLFLAKSFTSAPLLDQMRGAGLPRFLIDLVAAQPVYAPLHVLPPEYPLLTLIPFSLGLLAPFGLYRLAFALWMAVAVALVYFMLKKYRSGGAALAFAVYMVVGGWSTALGRFDIIPAALTLVALLCAERSRWKWAFALMALATMFKFYPLVLIIPLYIAQQMQVQGRWYAWRRWSATGVFVAVCVGVTVVSFLLSAEGTIAPLSYFSTRPIQIESVSASLLWLANLAGVPLHPVSSYGSLNVMSPLSTLVALLGTLLMFTGLGLTFRWQWRRKIDLFVTCLLTLLVVMVTGKVFSPQYLIWIFPLVAYVGQHQWKWLVGWGSTGLLTTWIFPFYYTATYRVTDVPALLGFYHLMFIRNILLLGMTLVLLYQAARSPSPGRSMPGTQSMIGTGSMIGASPITTIDGWRTPTGV